MRTAGGMMSRAQRQNPPALVSILTLTPGPRTQDPAVSVCIGCGCTDDHACVTAPTLDDVATGFDACFWIKVDRELGLGVCSECVDKIEEFEQRQQRLHRVVAEVNMEQGNRVPVNHGIADASVQKA